MDIRCANCDVAHLIRLYYRDKTGKNLSFGYEYIQGFYYIWRPREPT